MLLAIDPSTTTIGVALFAGTDAHRQFARVLNAAASIKLSVRADIDPLQRWLDAARGVENWLYDVLHFDATDRITELVFERPQFYSAVKSKGDPNKLVGVLGVAAVIAGRFSLRNATQQFTYLPAEWIGQLSKVCPTCKGKAKKKCKDCRGSAWETPRGRRIASRLSPEEHAACPDQNDAIDAVGIGLKHVGRLEPVRVYSNGR